MNDRDATADWLLSVHGRIARIVAGSLLIILGLGIIGGFLGVLLLIIGAIPIASAAYGTLLVGPLFGRDVHGRRPSDQPDEERGGEDEPPRAEEDGEAEDEEPRKEPDPDWSAPPLARAERPEGQGPRAKDIRAEDESPT
ncbi:MAG: DUF2892 domain-containing protein [Solirubrobacteraceae bacterium]